MGLSIHGRQRARHRSTSSALANPVPLNRLMDCKAAEDCRDGGVAWRATDVIRDRHELQCASLEASVKLLSAQNRALLRTIAGRQPKWVAELAMIPTLLLPNTLT